MLTSIRESDNQKVRARLSQKPEGPFSCPKCGRETILRKGKIRVHHFAHKPPITCEHGKGESEKHRKAKETIFEALSNDDRIIHCELEKDLGNVVPDIYISSDNKEIAIEVQISNLTMNEIIRRTENYNELGIYVLWLPLYHKSLNEERYSPKSWEKWLHATHYGRVYYWLSDIEVIPIHFDSYMLSVEGGYDYHGEYHEGYYKRSKRYRTPNRGPTLHLIDDFCGKRRDAWKGGKIVVPTCKIMQDNKPVWWKKASAARRKYVYH